MRISLRTITAALLPLAAALPQITRTGKYLYDPSGTRFYIKGIAYQPQGELAADSEANQANGGFPEPSSYIDPLSSEANCTRDLPYLQQLGVNAVRVYSVNPALNHDACMKLLDDAGIYVIMDVSLPLNGSIDRSAPSWTTGLLNEYIHTIDVFRNYDNVLAFNIGNEVVSNTLSTQALPYVKAAARDVKAYLKSVNSSVLVGYSAVDGAPDFRNAVAHYLTCGNDTMTVDLYGFNSYAWCGASSMSASGWTILANGFSDVTVPMYMSEFGCITSPPRVWTEVPALFSAPMSDVFSGGVAFSYFSTVDGFGMTEIDGNTVTPSSDFTRLAAQYQNITGPNSPAASSVTQTDLTCPAESDELRASSELPPTPDEDVCNCIFDNALACRVTNETANNPVIIGELIEWVCQQFGSNSSVSCDNIGGNGTTGTYGSLAMCSPAIKLSYMMTAYYDLNPVPQSCDFSGNATINPNGAITADESQTAAQQCLDKIVPGGVTTPTSPGGDSPSQTSSGSGSESSSPSGNGGNNSGATGVLALPGAGVALLAVLLSATVL